MRGIRLVGLALSALAACSSGGDDSLDLGPAVTSEGLAACADDGLDGRSHAGWHCVTYRGVSGISMGGGAAMRIGLSHAELFDVVGSLGSPYLDMEYFYDSVSEASGGGFCSMEQLLAHLDVIDVKDHPDTWCGPIYFGDLALPGTTCGGFAGDFNHYYRGTDAGRGGSFDREGSIEIVQDLALANGNPAFYNPESPYLPPGVPIDYHVPLDLLDDARAAEFRARRAEICATPKVLDGIYDGRYNPRGEHPVITFCDGDGTVNGVYDPGVRRMPFEVALAVDYNRNGVRDWAEPILHQPLEKTHDVGTDGIASSVEPGFDATSNPDPAGDDYDWLTNPRGTERNHRHDPGEPFDDLGLDRVAGTQDFGEANGQHDVNPNIGRAFDSSPRRLMEAIPDRMLDRLHLWADAGIRDFLYSAQITNQLWGVLKARRPAANLLTDWEGLRQVAGPAEGAYDPEQADLSIERIGRNAYLRYGDPSVCPDIDWVNGRGNHVGAPWEVLHRLRTMFAFAAQRFEGGDFSVLYGDLSEQGSPTGGIGDFVKTETFESAALGRPQPYVVIVPPDYYLHPEARYPVLYFLHGQGQKATDLAASALLFLAPMMTSASGAGSAWQKMIVVFADGECQAGECHTGTFYQDFTGVDGHGPRHGEAFFELMRVVEQRYRVKAPEMRR
ncbi:MAG: hypothetical protein IT384_19065 [Deltaproteobacteria bacterium]|nr:hypothetical protein [Deltaproteobacteria bacterium]